MFLRRVVFINVCLLELKGNSLNSASNIVWKAWKMQGKASHEIIFCEDN